VGLAFVIAMTTHARAADPPMRAIMQTKLLNTQALLKAIVTANYADIDRAANALDRISGSAWAGRCRSRRWKRCSR
jgi:hypothetical protein